MTKKNLIVVAIITVFVVIFFIIISSNQSNSNNKSNQISASSNSTNFETIATVLDLKKRLDTNIPNEVLIDVRTPEEFNTGHIKGAINIDVENPNFTTQIQKLDKNKTYIVFCRSGNRALVASEVMSKNALKTIYSKEGYTLWKNAGFETVK